jgi:tetratricopeptide (TPR) repeat protein
MSKLIELRKTADEQYNSGNYEKALETYEAILTISTISHDRIEAHYRMGLIYKQQGLDKMKEQDNPRDIEEFDKAKLHFEKVLEEPLPENFKITFYKDVYSEIMDIYRLTGEEEKYIKFIDESIETANTDEEKESLYIKKGDYLYSQGDYESAIEVFERALEINDENDYTYSRLADIYSGMGDEEKAEEYYKKVMELKLGGMEEETGERATRSYDKNRGAETDDTTDPTEKAVKSEGGRGE